jgi:hypothetical protein
VAFPFGGHPTLARFLEWATENGCTAEIKNRSHAQTGRPYTALEITRPGGGRAVVPNPDFNEHLAPSMVTYLQRRLGFTPKRRNRSPVAMFGTHNSVRIVAQRGTFFIWGNETLPLEEFANETEATLWKLTLRGARNDYR